MSKIAKEDIDVNNIHECLNHLKSDEIVDLINRYYDREQVSLLKSEYKIDYKSNSLLKIFPMRITEACQLCKTRIKVPFRSRDTYSYSYRYNGPCPSCGHFESVNCQCDNQACIDIREKKKNEELQRREEKRKNENKERF